MAKTMKAAVVRAFGKPLTIEELPIPTPGPGAVLIRVTASGVCHTDPHAVDGDWPVKPKLPFVPGHEGAGIVAAVGSGVSWIREGDPVGVAWLHDACGTCEHCVTGWETLCESQHKGTFSLVGRPPGAFPTPIFDVVLKRITIRGSIVGTRQDLAEAIAFATEGKVRAHVRRAQLENVNHVLSEFKAGKVDGRVVLDIV